MSNHDRRRPDRFLTRFNYREGPVLYLAQQIVRHIQSAGWNADASSCDLYSAKIVGRKPLDATFEDRFWEDIEASAIVVADKFDVEIFVEVDHHCDVAYIRCMPSQAATDALFETVLPSVWKQYTGSKAYANRTFK